MKKLIALLVTIICVLGLIGCDQIGAEKFTQITDTNNTTDNKSEHDQIGAEKFTQITDTNNTTDNKSEHDHQWQDVSGEHARVCTECNEKQLKSEACNFVGGYCDQPKECTICHAVYDELIEYHDWKTVSQSSDCWSTTIISKCSKCDATESVHGDYALPDHCWEEEIADGKTKFTCSRCRESNTFDSDIREFSYAQVLEKYKIGDPGVKHEHFEMMIESEITDANDAITRAKFDLTVKYDTISVSYDKESDVWCVDFWTMNMDGGSQSIYVKGNGLTCYIVYGE